jgi:hypothetical protein
MAVVDRVEIDGAGALAGAGLSVLTEGTPTLEGGTIARFVVEPIPLARPTRAHREHGGRHRNDDGGPEKNGLHRGSH